MWLYVQKTSLWSHGREILHRGLKSLDELDIVKEAERVAAAKITVSTNNFDFPEIPLDPIKAEAFWVSLDSGSEKL
jgi:hypothetical protein